MVFDRKFILDNAKETIMGVQLEYRSALVGQLTDWANENSHKYEGTSEFKADRFTDDLIQKAQDFAADNHYPLVTELFDN